MGEKFFDIPLLAKVSYDLKYVELGFSYKYGLTRNYKVPFQRQSIIAMAISNLYSIMENKTGKSATTKTKLAILFLKNLIGLFN